MKTLTINFAFLLLFFLALLAQVDTSTIAFQNVNVIPMDEEQILKDYTVITFGDLITEMGPVQSVTIPR